MQQIRLNETRHKKLVGMYVDWFNNFITVTKFAAYYGITESSARRLINVLNKHEVYGN